MRTPNPGQNIIFGMITKMLKSKNVNKHFSTSVWSVRHPNADQNVQYLSQHIMLQVFHETLMTLFCIVNTIFKLCLILCTCYYSTLHSQPIYVQDVSFSTEGR